MRIPEATTRFGECIRRRVGLEFENPLVDQNGSPITAEVIQSMYHQLQQSGWSVRQEPLSGNILSVEKPVGIGVANISTDCGWSSIELALPPADTLFDAQQEYLVVHKEVLQALPRDLRWLAIGLVPGKVLPEIRYKTTKPFYRLSSYLYYHNLFLPLNAHQVGLSLRLDEAIQAVNELIKISGLVVALCANSSIQNFSVLPWQEWRLAAWRFLLLTGTPGSSRMAGFPERPFTSIADYYSYFWSVPLTPFAAPTRNGQLIQISSMGWAQYFSGTSWRGRGLIDGRECVVTPDETDLNTASVTHWPFAKLHIVFDPSKNVLSEFLSALKDDTLERYLPDRYTNIYLEFRPVAAAPKGAEMAMPALMLGLIENLANLSQFTKQYTWQEWRELLDHAAVAGMDALIGRKKESCFDLLQPLIEIAKQGLKMRKCDEEKFLDELSMRVKKRQNPAQRMNQILQQQGRGALLDTITYE